MSSRRVTVVDGEFESSEAEAAVVGPPFPSQLLCAESCPCSDKCPPGIILPIQATPQELKRKDMLYGYWFLSCATRQISYLLTFLASANTMRHTILVSPLLSGQIIYCGIL